MASPLARLGQLDRRFIFIFIALAVIIPLVFEAEFPVVTTPIVQNIFDQVESLPENSLVLISSDYSPSTVPENQPMLEAVARHALHLGHRLVLITLWPAGPPMIENMIRNVIVPDFPDAVDGVDYVNFGFKAGNQGVINGAYSNFKDTFPVDVNGVAVGGIPLMAEVNRLDDFALIVGIGSGFPGVKEWIQFGSDRADVPMVGGVTAVEAPLLYPYFPKQLLGLMGGLQGAAEYEAALVTRYPQFEESSTQAVKRMGPQTVAHLVIIAFIVVGNIAYLASGRGKDTV